jgi:hypothetical protein
MTKLEELNATIEAACNAVDAAYATLAAYCAAAWDAWKAELEKQQESAND